MFGRSTLFASMLVGLSLATLAVGTAHAGPTLLFEPATGQVLYAEEQDLAWHPASLTKLMTAYLTFVALRDDKLNWDTRLVMSEKANAQPPSKVGMPAGGELALDVAVRALVIKSANDVAVALAEKIAGSEEAFVEQMNGAAKRLGMTRTVFVNANGLPDDAQVTTARDMGLLARALLKEFPEYAPVFAEQKMYIGRTRLDTHNNILKGVAGADGMKTGFICSAGFNIVASATRDGRKLVAVVLGETSGFTRAVRTAALLEYGFETYDWSRALESRTIDALGFDPLERTTAQDLRKLVHSRECGYRGAARARPVRHAKKSSKQLTDEAQVSAPASTGAAPQPVAAAPSTAAAALPSNRTAVPPGAVPAQPTVRAQ